MADEWEIVPLEKLVEDNRGISYGIVQPGTAVTGGVPIVRVTDIRNDRIATMDPLRVAPEIEASYARTRLRGGELLLTLVGTVGETSIVPKSLKDWNVARAVAVIPIRPEIGAYWVHIALKSPIVQQIIDSRLNTTVQATLNLRDVAQLPIVLPPRDVRGRIAHILGTLDDKIELNRRMNETLDAMVRALFKSWFVDFDPVRAKAEGRDPGLPKHIADLFPDRFEDSELGEIPAGWETRSLDDIANYLNGVALQKFPVIGNKSLPAIKIAQLHAGHTKGADLVGTNIPSQYVIDDGDVLFSWSGSLEVEIWCGGRGALNQHLFKVTSRQFPKWFYYLWTRHHLSDFQNTAANKATTMGHIQRQHLTAAKTLVPPANLQDAMNQYFAPLIDKLIVNRVESRTLAALRDTLLPRLVSGELRLKYAEKRLGAAV